MGYIIIKGQKTPRYWDWFDVCNVIFGFVFPVIGIILGVLVLVLR